MGAGEYNPETPYIRGSPATYSRMLLIIRPRWTSFDNNSHAFAAMSWHRFHKIHSEVDVLPRRLEKL